MFIAGVRISRRVTGSLTEERFSKKGKWTVKLGAGNTGEMIMQDMARLRLP
jgi:hypothetical protein